SIAARNTRGVADGINRRSSLRPRARRAMRSGSSARRHRVLSWGRGIRSSSALVRSDRACDSQRRTAPRSSRTGTCYPSGCVSMDRARSDLRRISDVPRRALAGTPFGVSAPPREQSMRTIERSGDLGAPLFTARQRDRRQAVTNLLIALTRALGRREDSALMRGAFEEAVRHAVPVRTVQLRDSGSRWMTSRTGYAPGAESIALDVPSPEPSGPAVLEATFDPGAPLGEWDFQMLGLAAQIAALVLEIERSHTQLARAGLLPSDRVQRESAAPLIGSTPAMQALRDVIGRVAATDFTVLLEGESGVGKELVARQIHELSRRRSGPFVAIN